MDINIYISDRVDNQISYFDASAIRYQKYFRRLKLTGIICNIATTLIIGAIFAFPEMPTVKLILSVVAFVSSTIVLGTYQLEEFQNNGAKWEKFRLVAEQMKAEKYLYLTCSGRYGIYALESNDIEKNQMFVDTIEKIIKATDISYFSLMVDPGRRIEKRLANQ